MRSERKIKGAASGGGIRATRRSPQQPAVAARAVNRLILMLVCAVPVTAMAQEEKHPVYVGAQECAKCHQGPGMGHQHCLWLSSKHAKAYASLAMPESKEIARLSGIPQEPQKSPVCLGCHATGSEAESWEKDLTFHIEDGVQCEMCHGPGSEYMAEEVMMNPRAARDAGLLMPTKNDCLRCHSEKGSHVAVLRQPAIDMDQAWREIQHPNPRQWRYMKPHPLPPAKDPEQPKHTGALACGQCHKGPAMGYQLSKWRRGPHANAYATLGSEAARALAQREGVTESPLTATACLKCHATAYHDPAGGTLDWYTVYEGVGCESCHGAGSDYSPEAVMRDRRAASLAGLKDVTRQTCVPCHENAHGKPFDYDAARQAIAHPTKLPAQAVAARYKTPLNMGLSPDGKEIYVACEASHTVIVVDVARQEKVAEITAGHHPTDVTFHPSGKLAYVSNRLDDTVSVIDVAARQVIQAVPVGDEPHGVRTDASGEHLYVLNTSTDSVSIIDTATLTETKRLEASRSPWALALSPDGSLLAVTNALPHFAPFRKPPRSEVTFLDTKQGVVQNRVVVPGANVLLGLDWHPSGQYALVVLNRTKNLVPMTRLLQGWTITNGLGIIWRDGRVDQVLLDEPNLCFADPTSVVISPDGRRALVSSSGTNRVAVVDLPKLISMLQAASDDDRQHVFPNHLGKPTEFVLKHIDVGDSPRGIVITRDGQTAFVANALDDSLTVIGLDRMEAVKRIDLGGPQEITKTRRGERLFHNAGITFHRQFSCHTCHPDGHVDGLTYDIEPDGLGSNPVDNRTLRGILDTAPFKWEGTNPSLQRQCGARLAVFFTRIQPFTKDELDALETYICTIPRPPNRYRPLGAELTDAQRRGKAMFQRTRTNDGRRIPKTGRCVTCHFPPLYTDRSRRDVGTKMELDHQSEFDVPHLSNIYDSAPYLHNGISPTLEEIWTKYNPEDQHGVTNDMTKDQLNDLIEYFKTL